MYGPSDWAAFWQSVPGALLGIAAVIGALGTFGTAAMTWLNGLKSAERAEANDKANASILDRVNTVATKVDVVKDVVNGHSDKQDHALSAAAEMAASAALKAAKRISELETENAALKTQLAQLGPTPPPEPIG